MGTKKKLLFVFNPFSGKAQIKNQLLDIVDVMVRRIMRSPSIRHRHRETRYIRSRRKPAIMISSCAAAGTVRWMKW